MITIRNSQEITKKCLELLLLADPSVKMIEKYIHESEIYIVEFNDLEIGIIALHKISNNEAEIKNIAIEPMYQGKGYGKELIEFVIKESKALGFSKIIICTGNSSIHQLKLYQNCGFIIVEVIKDYFVTNYKDEIWENGIQCRDLIKLEQSFKLKNATF